jgi:hypothetical protein
VITTFTEELHAVVLKKIDAVDALASRVYETVYGVDAETRNKRLGEIPRDPAGRRRFVEQQHGAVADSYRDALIERYGPDRGKAIKYAEAFEICEYGRVPTEQEIRRLFPCFPED